MTKDEILAVAKPILFNTEMVRAILDRRKTVTRRVIKPQPTAEAPAYCYAGSHKQDVGYWHDESGHRWKPPYHAGDYLYVRETWCELYHLADDMYTPVGEPCYYYAADGYNPTPFNSFPDDDGFFGDRDCPRWRPSIHMPKEAARIFLRVISVRAEWLQDITDKQIENEGIRAWSKDGKLYKYAPADREGDAPIWPWTECPRTPKDSVKRLWNGTIKPADLPLYRWEANPWVWVTEFERMEANQNG